MLYPRMDQIILLLLIIVVAAIAGLLITGLVILLIIVTVKMLRRLFKSVAETESPSNPKPTHLPTYDELTPPPDYWSLDPFRIHYISDSILV